MLDVAANHSASKPPTPPKSGGKRIPASLMKMRRESLVATGKYQLPKIEAGALPDNSLFSMTSKLKSQTMDATATSKDMDTLIRSGLATPRRTRRSFVIPTDTTAQSKRFSKLKSLNIKTSSSNCNDSLAFNSSNHSDSNATETPRSTRRMARPNRSKSSDDAVQSTPRRAARKPSVRRTSSIKERDEISSSSDDTPVPMAPNTAASSWKCTCGEEQGTDCRFCGMCGTTQRWECADCSYANKCKFRFCGMCGIPKTVKGQD